MLQIALKHFHADLKFNSHRIVILQIRIHADPTGNSTGININGICKIGITVGSGIDISEYRAQKSKVRNLLLCNVIALKHQSNIIDAICRCLMPDNRNFSHVLLLIGKRHGFFFHILSAKHRNFQQIFFL